MDGKDLNKRKEIDLDIADFLWEILRNWRMLLVCLLLGALLLTGYQYIADVQEARRTPEENVITQEQSLEEMENALGAQEMDAVLGAVALKKQLDEKSAYSRDSILMQINPYEENVVYLHYYVNGGTNEAAEVAEVYKNYVLNGKIASELVDIAEDENGIFVTTDNEITSVEIGAETVKNSFVVRIRGLSEDDCIKRAENVKNSLNNYSEQLDIQIPEHQLVLLEEVSEIVVDQGLVDLQNRTALAIKQIVTSLNSMKSNMTGNQLALYVRYTENVNETVDVTVEEKENTASTVRISGTKLILGAIIGLVLAIVWCMLRYLFAIKLRSEADIKTLYNVNILGYVRSKLDGKRGAIDQQILKSRYHHAGELSLEEEIDLICANIRVACQTTNKNTVYLTGSTVSSVPNIVWDKLKEKCEEKEINLVLGREICYHAEALEELATVGQVIFVEKIRSSYYEEIYKEIMVCKAHNIPVVGMIIVGA